VSPETVYAFADCTFSVRRDIERGRHFWYAVNRNAAMHRRRVVLYGGSLILGSVRASLQPYPDLEIVSLSAPFPAAPELNALAPDVILFDTESGCPDTAFSLLRTRPGLLLIGIDPSANQALLWTRRFLRELTTQDLVRVIEAVDMGLPGDPAE
jgi:hypothetical protein